MGDVELDQLNTFAVFRTLIAGKARKSAQQHTLMPKTRTSFGPGNPPPKSPGRPRTTAEQKWKWRIEQAAKRDYKEECRALLPIATDRIAARLERDSLKDGDLIRVTEVMRDSVHGKPPQAITGAGGGPLAFSFAQLVASVDGGKTQKI